MAVEDDSVETPLLSQQQRPIPSDEYSQVTDLPSSIDEIIENIQIGPFHYLFIITCGLCYVSYISCYNAIGFIIITACDLHIPAAKKGWLSLSFMAGILSSCYITGKLCDRFGRRKLLIICLTIHISGTIVAAFSVNYTMLLVIFSIIGACDGGVFTASSAYSVEFFPRSFRAKASGSRIVISTITIVYVSLVAFLILPHHFNSYLGTIQMSSWRVFLLVCTLPILPGYISLFYMPESLRFVIAEGKTENVLFVLNRINAINSFFKRQYKLFKGDNQAIILRNILNIQSVENNNKSKLKLSNNEQYTEKLYKRPWITRLILLSIIWVGAGFAIEGFTIWLPTIVSFYTSGNKCRHYSYNSSWTLLHLKQANQSSCTGTKQLIPVLTNILLGNLIGLPFPILCIFLINRVGRKWLSCIVILLTGLSIFFIWLFDNTLSTRILVCMFTMFVNCIWVSLTTWTLELFPTTKRATVIGILNIFLTITCGVGLMVVGIIFNTHCTITLLLFSLLCITAGLVCILLPDTTQKDIG